MGMVNEHISALRLEMAMVRQLRAEATRSAALRAAADLFLRVGHATATLSQVSAESGVTKGALYFHFASKEELSRALVDEGRERVAAACSGLVDNRSPALESVIGITYSVLELANSDNLVRIMYRLQLEVDGPDPSRGSVFGTWQNLFELLFDRAITHGDVIDSLDSKTASLLVSEVLSGVLMVAEGTSKLASAPIRMEQVWHTILPSLVPPEKLSYFREFASRSLSSFVRDRAPIEV
ncbi:TetR family transcriptional regulator [Rhodococcoides trifolii]|uniref:TetR family transcriptional regulator n=2 Tax=Rhodococcoides trifolii TaxID=908250 RepID=A0A917G139_9NOCA|nr:TetR family transcriptional regulator [Rhodococcus trifolii]